MDAAEFFPELGYSLCLECTDDYRRERADQHEAGMWEVQDIFAKAFDDARAAYLRASGRSGEPGLDVHAIVREIARNMFQG